jgi:TolA-binding protein
MRVRPAIGPARRSGPALRAPLCVLALLGLGLLALAACAKSGDVEKVAETNRVQDQRLKALEGDVGATLTDQKSEMAQLRTDVKAALGRMDLIDQRTQRMENEQKAITEGLERSLSEQRKLGHAVETELAKMAKFKLETDNDQDKMRIQMAELEKLLRSPISRLPAKTAADLEFRDAYYHLLSGEFDIAADAFEKWRKAYSKDERGPEALYRRGQAFFLLRRYDHALIPLFELVDKAPKSEFATPARWMVARSLEETGDLKLAREFYAALINDKTPYSADATRRVAFINRLFPRSAGQDAPAPKQ